MSEMTYWFGAACALTAAVVGNNYTILAPLAMGILPRALDSAKQHCPYFSKDNCKDDLKCKTDSKLQEEDKLKEKCTDFSMWAKFEEKCKDKEECSNYVTE